MNNVDWSEDYDPNGITLEEFLKMHGVSLNDYINTNYGEDEDEGSDSE